MQSDRNTFGLNAVFHISLTLVRNLWFYCINFYTLTTSLVIILFYVHPLSFILHFLCLCLSLCASHLDIFSVSTFGVILRAACTTNNHIGMVWLSLTLQSHTHTQTPWYILSYGGSNVESSIHNPQLERYCSVALSLTNHTLNQYVSLSLFLSLSLFESHSHTPGYIFSYGGSDVESSIYQPQPERYTVVTPRQVDQ